MKNLKIDEDTHDKLLMLKGIYGMKNMTEVLEKLFFHAGYTPAWFDKMRDLGVERQ